jgi:hypothetical protein
MLEVFVFKRVLCFGSAIFLFALFCQSFAIQVSGDIWGIWDPANNPFEVIGDLHVPPDSSLTILPGCSVQFMGHYKMQVDSLAKLTAIGTAQDSIYFFPIDTVDGWAGLRLYYADTTSGFGFCSFKYRVVISGETIDGAISCIGGKLKIDHSAFFRNRYGRIAGACIYSKGTKLIDIDNSRFIENNFNSSLLYDGWGGAIYIEADFSVNPQFNIDKSTFLRNESGAILCFCSSKITNSLFMDNRGVTVGQYHGDTFRVEYNVICNNRAIEMPSAIMAQEVWGPVLINNNTICNNVTGNIMFEPTPGVCGIWDEHSGGTNAYFNNNILWGDSTIPLIGSWGCVSYVNFTDIRGGYSGIGNIDIDPLFVGTVEGNFNLQAGSPCIDAGDTSSPFDPDWTRADMGALPFSHAYTVYLPGDISGDGQRLGADVTYGVRYFKGVGIPPPDSVFNDSTASWLYAAGDVNGNCEFRGSDITYLVGYFKSINPILRWCNQTPPYSR